MKHMITWNGTTMCKGEWAAHFGISTATLSRKLSDGVPFERMGERQTDNMRGKPKGAKDLKPRKPGTGRFPKSEQHKARIAASVKAHRREQRLQKLREEFEAARDELAADIHAFAEDPCSATPEQYGQMIYEQDLERMASWHSWTPSEEACVLTARRFIIARDFNEFDPKRADMLWKLQDNR